MFSVERIVSNDKVFCGDCIKLTAEYVLSFVSEFYAPLYIGGRAFAYARTVLIN